MKPCIKLLSPGKWQCFDAQTKRTGKTAKQAYDRWQAASRHVEAKTKLKHVRLPHQNLTIAKPRPVAPIATPQYHESIVQQVTGTRPRPAYVPPPGLRINMARAAQAQGSVITPQGIGNEREFSTSWASRR